MLLMVGLIKLLPNWQLGSAGSPRRPGEDQNAAATEIAQSHVPSTLEQADGKIGRRITELHLLSHRVAGTQRESNQAENTEKEIGRADWTPASHRKPHLLSANKPGRK